MKAYIYFKVPREQAEHFNAFATLILENKKLMKLKRGIEVVDSVDVLWYRDNLPHLYPLHLGRLGEGECRVFNIREDEGAFVGLTHEEIQECIAQTFYLLHQKFDIRIHSDYRFFSKEYFSAEQVRRITKNGRCLGLNPEKIFPEDMKTELPSTDNSPTPV